jgi:hypothetical protein
MRTTAAAAASGEEGQAIVETLLAFSLVLLTLALAAQALAYLDVRLLAREAAAEAAQTAAQQGTAAGTNRAHTILAATPGLTAHLHTTTTLTGNEVTVEISGNPPSFGPFAALVPAVHEQASLPLERYPAVEAQP